MLVDAGNRAEHASGELARAHLHAENRHRQAIDDGDMLGDVERQGRLAHRRTAGHDDQVAALQARGHFIELRITGRHAGDIGRIILAVEVIDFIEHAGEHRLDLEQSLILARAGLGDLEDLRLGLVKELPHLFAAWRKCALGNFGRHLRQAPLHRALAHQLGVAAHVERARRVLRQRREISGSAGLVLVLARLDRLGDGDHVGRTVVLE